MDPVPGPKLGNLFSSDMRGIAKTGGSGLMHTYECGSTGLTCSPRPPSMAARTCDGRTHTRSECEVLPGHVRACGLERDRARHRRYRAHLDGLMPVLLHMRHNEVLRERRAPNKPARGQERAHTRSVREAFSTARISTLHAMNASVRALGMLATMLSRAVRGAQQCA